MADSMNGPVSGIDKACAVLLGLGVDLSSKVLQYLTEAEIERVLLALGRTGPIPPEVRSAALEEACEFSAADNTLRGGGVEYSRQLLARAVGPRRGAEILERISVHQQMSSFEMLRNANPQEVAALLQDEMPQTIALVLSYLEAKVAADILTNMPKELQIEVTLRLAMMDRVSPQVVQVVERNLKNKLSRVISEADFRATGGVSFLVKMLNQVDRGVQKTIFEALETTNPKLVEEIRANMFTFDDLAKLDDRAIQRVLRDINKADLAMALKAAPERLKEKIYSNLSERARENLKEEIEILGPQLAKNVYSAQRKIVDAVRALEEAGEIVIGGGGEYEIIQ
ncbi:MAG TPA: flagellar motor switch protein FliG [Anaerolinea thermolimosa]|uniref:Flagellar motor switch protein FliG n=1 Tax=Anaerolinea thermolimosa TaxID=229919 RepID=A0A3D1JHE9_9CHLR|nr:flagellar motor switch protein FliG [Anaerolinea thermolimosa]